MTVGAAALDAADQAKRAADLAERASTAALSATRPVVESNGANGANGAIAVAVPPGAGPLDDFSARADRLAERLSRLQRIPLYA